MVKRKDETWTEHRLRTDFGMSQEDWDSLFLSQAKSCAICGATEPGRKDKQWCLDHDHETNKPRGILCNGCNMGIGNFRDNTQNIASAIEYLLRSKS